MKLMEWIDRQPVRVGFGRRSGGAIIDPDSTGGSPGSLPPPPSPVLPPDFSTRSAVQAADIDISVDFVRTAGYAAPGDGGGGLYVRRASEPLHNLKIQSADGAHWELVLETNVVTEKQAGGVGDGIADDTQAIQDAINYAIYNRNNSSSGLSAVVEIVGPFCRITDTIHLGYGESFHGVVVRGTQIRRRAGVNNTGTSLISTFTDRPIIAIQGGRMTELADLWIEGALDTSSMDPNSFEITEEATWDAFGGGGRYNPYAAIAIDPYSGPRPAQSYPDVTYPDFLQPIAQYNKGQSSDTRIRNIGVRNVNTALVVQPSDFDANADFTKIVDCNFDNCKYAVSIGNGQSRNVEIRNMVGANVFTVFTNDTHGKQRGRFGGPITNCSFGGFIGRLFQFSSTSLLGTVSFSNLYVEGLDRIGDFTTNTGSEGALTFQSCQIVFRHNETKGIPANILGGSNTTEVIFRECQFARGTSVYSFATPNVCFVNCRSIVDQRASGTIERYLAFAHNATSGGIVTDGLSLQPQTVGFTQFNLDTGTAIGGVLPKEGLFTKTSRPTGIPLMLWSFSRASEIYGTPDRKRLSYFERSRQAHFASVTLSGRTLTLVFTSLPDDQAMRFGVMPGDIIRDRTTGMVFFIRSRNGATVIAEAQNNYVSDGVGGITTVEPFSTTSGSLQFMNARIYTPTITTLGDFQSGTKTATNAGRFDGFAGYLDTDIVVGDYLFADQDSDFIFAGGEAEVTAINSAAQTITFAGNARNSVSGKSLTQWVRLPPPNS